MITDFESFQSCFKKMGIWFEVDIPNTADESYRVGVFFSINLSGFRLYFSQEGAYLGMKNANGVFTEKGNIPLTVLIDKTNINGEKL